jgi:hypothetical protein
MANSFVSALRKEIAAIEVELEGDPRFKKLKRLMAALDAYLEDDDDQPTIVHSGKIRASEAGSVEQHGRTPSERTLLILDAAEAIIRASKKPIRTIEILEELQRRKIDVHGDNPRNTLSAILSYSGRFKAHGRSGWTAKEDDDPDENTEAADGPSLAGRSSTASAEHRLTNGGTRAEPVKPRPGGGT